MSTDDECIKARRAGLEAAKGGALPLANPYTPHTDAYREWLVGWRDAWAELVRGSSAPLGRSRLDAED
jgi:ribosome modulation factor